MGVDRVSETGVADLDRGQDRLFSEVEHLGPDLPAPVLRLSSNPQWWNTTLGRDQSSLSDG
jgi:hypothetical protein